MIRFVFCRQQIDKDKEAVLGRGGVIIGDSGTGSEEYLMTPIDNPKTLKERLFNFFHSSTRMIGKLAAATRTATFSLVVAVEQVFGIWKNRFRCLLQRVTCDPALYCLILQTTMVLHNMCMIHNEGLHFDGAADEIVQTYLKEYDHGMCPDCKRKKKLHCVHASLERYTPKVLDNNAKAYRNELMETIWNEHGDNEAVLAQLRNY